MTSVSDELERDLYNGLVYMSEQNELLVLLGSVLTADDPPSSSRSRRCARELLSWTEKTKLMAVSVIPGSTPSTAWNLGMSSTHPAPPPPGEPWGRGWGLSGVQLPHLPLEAPHHPHYLLVLVALLFQLRAELLYLLLQLGLSLLRTSPLLLQLLLPLLTRHQQLVLCLSLFFLELFYLLLQSSPCLLPSNRELLLFLHDIITRLVSVLSCT